MKNKYTLDIIKNSHKGCFKNKDEVLNFEECGCFYCTTIFSTSEIDEWIEESDGKETAVCPKCGIDSILSEKYPIFDKVFLDEMQFYWF